MPAPGSTEMQYGTCVNLVISRVEQSSSEDRKDAIEVFKRCVHLSEVVATSCLRHSSRTLLR